MISKIIHSKIFIFIVLLIIFSFVINTNVSFARKISFSLHDGLIKTLIDDEERPNDEEEPNDDERPGDNEKPEDEERPNDEESQNNNLVQDGIYYIAYSQDTNYVLDVKQGSLDNGGTVQLNTRNNDTNQKFYIHYIEDGYYQIENISSTKTIEVKDGSTEAKALIQQYDDNGTDAQRWKIIKNEDETYTFIAKCSGKAIDIADGAIEAGTVIQQYDYNGTHGQKFILEETELFNEGLNHGIVIIRSKGDTSKHLDVTNCSPDEGTLVHLWTDSPTLAQRFQLERVGKNEVRIRTAASGGYLKESENKIGASVIQSGNSKTGVTDSNTWKVEYDKGIIFINKESGLVLTINGDYVDDAKIEVNTRTDDLKQRFIVRPIDLIPNGQYKLYSKYGTVLSVPSNSQGIQLKTAADSGSVNLIFEISKYSNGYKLMSSASGWTIDVHGGSRDNAAIVQTERDAGTTSERWIPILQDGGYINFKNVNSGLMLNVHLFNQQPGAEINQGLEDHSDAQLWKLTPTQLTNAYVRRNGTEYYKVDGSGNFTLIARNVGGWDFTDWDYVMRMKANADANGSATDWYAIIDCDKPCRDLFFHRENGQWVAVAGYYAVQGFITLEGGSRTVPGIHTVDHKYEWSIAGPGYITSYVPHWIGGVVSPETDDAQVFHGSWERGSSGYSTHGCSAVTLEYSKWIYDNIPLGSTVHVVGNATGIPSGADPDMPQDVQVLAIQDPFA